VPGYAAPDDTIDPAVRVARVLAGIAADIDQRNLVASSRSVRPGRLDEQLAEMCTAMGLDIDHDVLAIGVLQWAQLFGFVSFELFGSFANTFDDADDLFEHHIVLNLQAYGLA
jgi:hypothetical protein